LFEAAAAPRSELFRRTVGRPVRGNVPGLHPLNAVVAYCCRCLEPCFDVAGLDGHASATTPLGGVTAPNAREAIGLQFERDRERILLIGPRGLRAPHLCVGAQQRLHVMPELVCDHVGTREVARRTEALLELAEEPEIEIHL